MSCRSCQTCVQWGAIGLDVDWDWNEDGDEWLTVDLCQECNQAGILCHSCGGLAGAPHCWGGHCDECRNTGLAFFGPRNEESPQA